MITAILSSAVRLSIVLLSPELQRAKVRLTVKLFQLPLSCYLGDRYLGSGGPNEKQPDTLTNFVHCHIPSRPHPPFRLSAHTAVLLSIACALTWGCRSDSEGPPYDAEDALDTFALEAGFRIELVAAEPLVMDPVAMTIDEHGRIYVAEMPGYPLDTGGSGRVKMLHDTDGDGRPDDATLFADGLRLPTGIMRWREGVLVTDPPDVLYLADTTHDGVADIKHVMLTGFALSNPQHNANTPVYGLDNWIYIANNGTISRTEKYADVFGDRGGNIRFPGQPAAPQLPRNGSDQNVRFRPHTYELEQLSSRSQFGQTFDPWGRHFLVNNSRHHMHEVIPARYFHPGHRAAVATARHSTSDHGDAARVFPITESPQPNLLTDQGVFTSACGLTWYVGGAFPAPYDQVTFVAEPVHNLVHTDLVQQDGPTFTARRLHPQREFLASTDSWFRPVHFSVGPDGALYLVDYYREIIEHPEWMDDSLATHGTLTRGGNRGRLYRIVHDGAHTMDWYGRIELGESVSLVRHLSSPNGWWRMTAQRLLVDQSDPQVIPMLRALADTSDSPLARLHALWTLNGMGVIHRSDVHRALQDPDPGVRENAVKLAQQHPNMTADLLLLADDPDTRVRFMVLGALQNVSTPSARAAQYDMLWKDISSPWFQHLALLVIDEFPEDLLHAVATRTALPSEARSAFLEKIAAMVGAQATPELAADLVNQYIKEPAILRGMVQGLQLQGKAWPLDSKLLDRLTTQVMSHDAEDLGTATLDLLSLTGLPADSALMARAATLLEDMDAPAATRARAARLLGIAGTHADLLRTIAGSADSLTVRRSAIQALRDFDGDMPAHALLEIWSTLTPSLRHEALSVFDTQTRATLLVAAMEEGRVLPAEIPWNYRVRLMRDTKEPVRSRARQLLRVRPISAGVRRVPDLPGDSRQGQDIFLAVCGSCHRSEVIGSGMLGPDLATVRHWSHQDLLDKMVDPNRSIASGYEQWAVTLTSGSLLEGIIASETPSTITVSSEHATRTIMRTDITSITPIAHSAMPYGLLEGLNDTAVANLLAFLSDR